MIGRTLEAARSARGRTLAHAAAATDLDLAVLQALEAEDFASIGDQAMVKGCLRTYARYLGLDPEPLLDRVETPDPAAMSADPAPRAVADQAIGVALRSARRASGEQIDEIAATLGIESGVLASLEAEDFEAAGGQVLAKAHLRRYARHLGLDAEPLLDRYAGPKARRADPPSVVEPSRPEPARSPPPPLEDVVAHQPRRVQTVWEPPPPKRRRRWGLS